MLEQEDLTQRLSGLPLLASLKEEDLEFVANLVKPVHFAPGEVVFQQGDESDRFYLLESGQVRVTARDEKTGAEVELTRLNAGDFFGEAGLLAHEPRNATVTAVTEAHGYYLEADGFALLRRRFPKIRKQIEQRAERRVHGKLQHFSWMLEDEVPLYVSHRHIVAAFLGDIVRLMVIAIVFVLAAVFVYELLPSHPGMWLMVALAIILIVGSGIALWHYIDWINDYFIVTHQRVVHIERVQLIRESRQEAPLDMVQNVILERDWLAARLNYGTLRIELVGSRLLFDDVPHPEAVQQQILQQRARLLGIAHEEERAEMRRTLQQAIYPSASPASAPSAVAAAPPSSLTFSLRQSLRRFWQTVLQTRIERDGEITWRKHHWILIKQIIRPVLILLVGIAVTIGLTWASFELHWPLWVLGVVVILIGLGGIVWEWEDWRNDLYILTPDRIIDIERLPFGLKESRREGGLDRIQDIQVLLPNILASTFNVGHVVIKTAAAGGDFTFNYVADPRSVQRDIFRQLARFRRQQQIQERQRRFAEMAQWFSVYTELVGQSAPPKDK